MAEYIFMDSTHSTVGALTPADFRTGDIPECRNEPRIACSRTIQILPCFHTEQWRFSEGELFNCSLRGLGIYTPEPMTAGEQFLAKLNIGRVVLLIYSVRHCSAVKNHRFAIGAEFTGFVAEPFDKTPEEVLKAILESDGAAPPSIDL